MKKVRYDEEIPRGVVVVYREEEREHIVIGTKEVKQP